MSVVESWWPKSWGVECGVASVLSQIACLAPSYALSPTASHYEWSTCSPHYWKKNVVFFYSGLETSWATNITIFFNVLLSNSSYMLSNVNSILQSSNIKYYEIFYCNINSLIGKVRCLEIDQNWHMKILKELLNKCDGQTDCCLTHRDIREFHDDICLL